MRKPLTAPSYDDLLKKVKFDPELGKIWLDESRMLMIHSSVFGQLRKELIEMLGWERAKAMLMRFGYHSGRHDAELAKRLRPDLEQNDSFVVGPQLHKLEGYVRVEPITLRFNVATGEYYGEFDWHDSWEAEQHIAEYGLGHETICWTLLGYASGYTSYYMGRQIVFKETQCVATGASHCVNIGRPIEEWEDSDTLEQYLVADPIINELELLKNQYDQLKNKYYSKGEDQERFATIGRSENFLHVCKLIHKAASVSKVTILLTGETGVGKEVLARNIHRTSDRAKNNFVAVNCACISPDLIEAELFGVEKGAYTGATQSREGKFERAHGGTIFLDEVIELTPRAQASLLRVLQEEELERVGDTHTRKIDVRVVAATNENLEEAVKEGRFRSDLYFRLNVFPVNIPPLRNRRDDIPLLIEHFLEKYHLLYNKRTLGVTDKALQALMAYKWPGNIRELENMIERGVILVDNNRAIDLTCFFPSLGEPTHPLHGLNEQGCIMQTDTTEKNDTDRANLIDKLLDLSFGLDELEDLMIERAMLRSDSVISHTAKLLKVSRPSLDYRLKKRG